MARCRRRLPRSYQHHRRRRAGDPEEVVEPADDRTEEDILVGLVDQLASFDQVHAFVHEWPAKDQQVWPLLRRHLEQRLELLHLLLAHLDLAELGEIAYGIDAEDDEDKIPLRLCELAAKGDLLEIKRFYR